MELRGQDKRITGGGGVGIPSNFTYGFTSIISATGGGGGGAGDQRRRDGNNNNNSTAGNGAVSSALNPSQTLDHQFHNLLHQQNHNRPSSSSISPQPQVPQSSREALRDEDSDSDPPDPDPVPVPATVDKSGTTPTPTPTPTIRYKECLKNHAASIGGHVVDGCGEFMPSSEEGTPGALKCAACDCHRSFHRKEVEGEVSQSVTKCYFCYNRNNKTDTKTRVLPPPLPHGPPPPPSTTIQHHQKFSSKLPNSHQGGLNQPMMMAFGGGGGTDQSSSEEFNVYQSNVIGPGHHHQHQHPSLQPGQPYTMSSSSSKKRFRTKFSQEQKEKMSEFAERIGWRLTKEDEAAVQQFCVEVGVKRQVLKVWMHNNKHISMKKKSDEEEL